MVHQVTSGIVHQTMTNECIFAGKSRRHDVYAEMSAPTGAGMAGVAVRFVGDGQRLRCQCCQAFVQQGDGGFVAHAGSAFLNGLTVTFSYTPAAM